jgi:hypothetical protein
VSLDANCKKRGMIAGSARQGYFCPVRRADVRSSRARILLTGRDASLSAASALTFSAHSIPQHLRLPPGIGTGVVRTPHLCGFVHSGTLGTESPTLGIRGPRGGAGQFFPGRGRTDAPAGSRRSGPCPRDGEPQGQVAPPRPSHRVAGRDHEQSLPGDRLSVLPCCHATWRNILDASGESRSPS